MYEIMYVVGTLMQWALVIFLVYLGICILRGVISALFKSNTKGTKSSAVKDSKIKSNKSSYKHKSTKTHASRNHQLKELKKVKLIQKIHNQGRELGMLITTIENINKSFKPIGTILTGATLTDLSFSEGMLATSTGNASLDDLEHVLIKRLVTKTHQKGGNALIGVRIFMGDGDGSLYAYGTVVKTY